MEKGAKILLGLGLLAGAGFFGYKLIGKKNSKEETLDPIETDPLKIYDQISVPIQTTVTANTTSNLKDKIKRMQAIIRVTADGIIGPKTIDRLNKYMKVQSFTVQNADRIIAMLETIVPAVDSFASFRSSGTQVKAAKWNYWINQAKSKKFDFDPFVTNAYINITGRSLYIDYGIKSAPTTYSTARSESYPISGIENIQNLMNNLI